LALELTKCHLSNAGRPIVETCNAPFNIGNNYSYDIPTCLSTLNGFDFSVYTQFYLYVNEICQRLTDSIIIQQKLEASFLFEKRAIEMETNINHALVRLSSMSSHLELANSLFHEINGLKMVSLIFEVIFIKSIRYTVFILYGLQMIGNVIPSLRHQFTTINPIFYTIASAIWSCSIFLLAFLGVLLFSKVFVPLRIRGTVLRFVIAVVFSFHFLQSLLEKYGIWFESFKLITKKEVLESWLYSSITLVQFYFFFLRSSKVKDRKVEVPAIYPASGAVYCRTLNSDIDDKLRKIVEKIECDAEIRRREHDRMLLQLSMSLDRHIQHSSTEISPSQSSIAVPFVSPQRCQRETQSSRLDTWILTGENGTIEHFKLPIDDSSKHGGNNGTTHPNSCKRSCEEVIDKQEMDDTKATSTPAKKLKSTIQQNAII